MFSLKKKKLKYPIIFFLFLLVTKLLGTIYGMLGGLAPTAPLIKKLVYIDESSGADVLLYPEKLMNLYSLSFSIGIFILLVYITGRIIDKKTRSLKEESALGNVVVKLENVRKRIGGTEIIRGLSFEVREGEVYGFLGPNGSGKTTTIRMMTGLISMTEGDITICGHSIRTEREKALEQIGAIVENPELYDYMTGMQNLKHFANMAITPISKERIAEIVKLVELEHAIHKKGENIFTWYETAFRNCTGITSSAENFNFR